MAMRWVLPEPALDDTLQQRPAAGALGGGQIGRIRRPLGAAVGDARDGDLQHLHG